MRFARFSFKTIVALCAMTVACSAEQAMTEPIPPYLTMLTEHASYRAGNIANVRLINHSEFPLSYYHCDMVLDVLTGSGWRRAEMANLPCLGILSGVPPRSERTAPIVLPEGTPTGTYRVRFDHVLIAQQFGTNDGLVPAAQLSTNVFAVQQSDP